MIFVPLPITPSPPASLYFVPIPSTESTLNVNVPEFLPKNYKPVNGDVDGDGEAPVPMEPLPTEATTTAANITTNMTTNTNESAKPQNETTNIHTNSLNNDTKCTQPVALDNQHVTNGVDANASNAAKNEKNTNNNNSHHHHQQQHNKTKSGYVAAVKQNGVTVSIMSDLLKTNSDNLNLDACSFNNENSHTNLKADLGNKKITNNISKSKVYKNDSYCNDSGSSKSTKIMNSNKNAKTRHAYPKTKETPKDKPCDNLTTTKTVAATVVVSKGDDQPSHDAGVLQNGPKEADDEKEKLIEKPGLTYAQMVVPTKTTNIKATAEMTTTVNEPKAVTEVKVAPESSKLPKSPMKNGKHPNQHARKNYPNKKKPMPENRTERPKPIEGSVEWFTVGAKGKKHVAPNGNTVAEIAFENESKVEKVNKIAEELQLDINKDSDLAMDIMDSLAISEEKSEEVVATKAPRKKKTAAKPKKKAAPKDKANKDLKRTTFDIIEPNFEKKKDESKSKQDETTTTTTQEEEETEEIVAESNEECVEREEKNASEPSLDSFVFDPNVFATPCNLQMDSLQRSTGGKLGNPLRLSTGKPVRNLFNTFDIYQQDFTSVENQQLKQEEEMVIKILQQLNKSFDAKVTAHKTELIETVSEVLQIETESIAVNPDTTEARENSVERFAINAKPYQNVYSSNHFLDQNHFLEHSFGDRNDKSDRVVISTDLSSSDQSYVEDDVDVDNDNDDDVPATFDTYPVIGNEEESNEQTENGQTQIEDKSLENEGKSTEYEIESEHESITNDIEHESQLIGDGNECEAESHESIENGIEREQTDVEIQVDSTENGTANETELNQIETKSQNEVEQHIEEPKEDIFNITKALEQILRRRSEVESKVEGKLQDEAAEVIQVADEVIEKPQQLIEEGEKEDDARNSEQEIEQLEDVHVSQRIEQHENELEAQIESENEIDVKNMTETKSNTVEVVEQKTEETQAFEFSENDEDSTKPIENPSAESVILNEVLDEELRGETVQLPDNESTGNEFVCHDRESISFEEIQNKENESIRDKQIELSQNETASVPRETEPIIQETETESVIETVPPTIESSGHDQNECASDNSLICEEPKSVSKEPAGVHLQNSAAAIEIQIQPATDECANETKDNATLEIEAEPISLETESSSIETDPHDVATCNQSIKSNSSNSTRPWLRIVDTQMLQQQKKLQQTFPITTAVSMWLNQVQKEKTPEPIFRLPGDNRFFSAATAAAAAAKYKKQDSQTSHSNSSIDLTEDTASITSDRFHINDDEEEDIMNFWESPTLMTPQSPTPPPIYNSVYGSSINYANLLSNKNELLCNNIIDYEVANGKHNATHENLHNKNGFNQNNAADTAKAGMDEKCYRPPPEVCCTIM